jgi:hypothetical protein
MGLIKSFVTKGGVHYMKTLYYRFVTKENSIASHMTNNTLYFTNHAVPKYSDFVLKMLGKGQTVSWDNVDKDSYFASLMHYVQAQCIDLIHEKSAFYRLYKAFQDNDSEQDEITRAFVGFTEWVSGLNEIYLSCGLNMSSSPMRLEYVRDILHTELYDYNEICDGIIYIADFLALKDSILNFNPLIYKKFMTKGILFNGRGHYYGALSGLISADKCLERSPQDLLRVWHRRNQYSSFFRCTDLEVVVDGVVNEHQKTSSGRKLGKKVRGNITGAARFKRTVENLEDDEAEVRVYHEVVKFGQINSVWRNDMPGDKVVHGLAFANATFRKVKYDEERRHYCLEAVSLRAPASDQKFICVNNIDSTSIAVSAVSKVEEENDATGKIKTVFRPMLKPDGVQSFIQCHEASQASSVCYAPHKAKLHALYLLELHPERLSFQYENILDDVDGTKLWEHK